MNAIEIRGVSKTFGSHRAVNDLSLEVPDGSIYGFIGPNGSGKTTTIRMIMSIILPDSGQISVLGERSSGAARDAVGYLPEERGLYKKMSVRRLLRLLRKAQGPKSGRARSGDPALARPVATSRLGGQADRSAVERHGAEGAVHRRHRLQAASC